jgi:hypothetical protein
VYALLNPGNEIEFPDTALELPTAKRHEYCEEQDGERAHHDQGQQRMTVPHAADSDTLDLPTRARCLAASRLVPVRRLHCMLGIFIIESGIIL